MANTYLINIGINDNLQDVIRKVNDNFRNISRNQTQQTQSSVRQEASRSDAALSNAIGEINVAVENGLKQIEQKANDLEDALDKKFANLQARIEEDINAKLKEIEGKVIPPIGTYVMCDYDPNTQWSGTTWRQQESVADTIPVWKRTK